MKYCTRCVMPETRPGIKFNSKGVCSACEAYDAQLKIDWNKRMEEFKDFCSKYRRNKKGSYDCIIAVSGGKDSHFQVYMMKEVMGMNPLLVSAEDNFTMTKAGVHNLQNISEEFGCDIISLKPNRKVQKRLIRKMFEKYLKPTWYIDRLIYTYPLHMALKLDIPLLVYGENISRTYGGVDDVDTYSARDQISNGVALSVSKEELLDDVVTEDALSLLDAPSPDELKKIDPMYLSYFVPWNSYHNYQFAKKRGFWDLEHEWNREHTAEQFDQVDTYGYIVHAWLKYPKFGHASATDYASRFIRYGMMTREEAVKVVKERDHKLDALALQDFLNFTGYSTTEFWAALEKFWNPAIFKKINGEWVLRHNLDKTGCED